MLPAPQGISSVPEQPIHNPTRAGRHNLLHSNSWQIYLAASSHSESTSPHQCASAKHATSTRGQNAQLSLGNKHRNQIEMKSPNMNTHFVECQAHRNPRHIIFTSVGFICRQGNATKKKAKSAVYLLATKLKQAFDRTPS